MKRMDLNDNEIHLWLSYPDEIQNQDILLNFEKLLSSDEKLQKERFHFKKHQHQYLISRTLLRCVLSNYIGIEPTDIYFSKNAYGKPEIDVSGFKIRFNLSHTDGLIALAVALKYDIGIDVENIDRNMPIEIVDRFFSKSEAKDIHNLSGINKCNRFFDYWTLKESYIKAKGMGLSLPLDQFSFHIYEHKPIEIYFEHFDQMANDNPNNWQFWLFMPTNNHKIAISFRQNKEVYQIFKTYKFNHCFFK